MKRIKDDMVSLIDEPCAFTEAVLLQFVRSITYTDDRADNGDQTIVTNMVAKVRALLNQAIPIQDEIHEYCGSLAAEYQAANLVCRYLNTTLGYLEDIEYYFDMEGISEICVAHSMGELMYQKGIRFWVFTSSGFVNYLVYIFSSVGLFHYKTSNVHTRVNTTHVRHVTVFIQSWTYVWKVVTHKQHGCVNKYQVSVHPSPFVSESWVAVVTTRRRKSGMC